MKTGTVNTASSIVTWNITATRGAVSSSDLVVDGDIGVKNSGNGPATVGNIVVNLQTKVNGKWVTQSSDIADATNGDAATFAHVVQNADTENRTSFSENAASGHLNFMNAKHDTLFSLVPEVTIPPNTTVPLEFTATFENSVLHLAAGTKAHIEVIVTFGNNAAGGPNLTDTNVDINGNGVIDPDEAKVRSVSTEIDKTVMATSVANSSVTISDGASDISTQGTVTFSNPVFNLGSTTGTVTVSYDGGTMGGSITNCAHAVGGSISDQVGQLIVVLVPAVQLDVCNTQTVGPHVCIPGAPGCGWKDGDLTSYNEVDWATDPSGLLANDFASVYGPVGGSLIVGLPTNFAIVFSGPTAISQYLPSSGPPGPLDSSLLDPLTTSSGVYGGDVVALKLDVDFADAHDLPSPSGVVFGDLSLCGFAVAGVNGMTIRQFLAAGQTLLGGGTGPFAIDDIQPIMDQLIGAFSGGAATAFAQDHVVNGACP